MSTCEFGAVAAPCGHPATHIAHDKRGCRKVCDYHAYFLAGTSQAFGHRDCPSGYPEMVCEIPFQRLTRLP